MAASYWMLCLLFAFWLKHSREETLLSRAVDDTSSLHLQLSDSVVMTVFPSEH